MNWKDLLKSVLGPLVAYLYTQLISHYPSFPMFDEDFVAVILWIVGLVVGGWGLAAMWMKSKLKKAGYNYEKMVQK